MRNAEVIRQWKILKTVEAGRYTTTQALADEYSVTERTIRRDIEALQEAGFPLYDDRQDGRKVWRLVQGYKQKLTQSFTLAELAALYFGKNLLSFLGGAPFAQDLESAFAKIREALPARSLPYLSRIQELFAARPEPAKDYSRKKDVIAGLVDATLHQRQVVVSYYSFNSRKTKAYTLDPYRLVYYHGGLYLYARAHEHAEVRTFAVERIEHIDVQDSTFEMPKDFNVSEYARGPSASPGAAERSCSRWTPRGGVRSGAGVAREPELEDRADGSVASACTSHRLRAQGLDQGLPAPYPGDRAGLAAPGAGGRRSKRRGPIFRRAGRASRVPLR